MDLGIITIFFILKLKVIRLYELTSNCWNRSLFCFAGLSLLHRRSILSKCITAEGEPSRWRKWRHFSHNVNMVKLWLNHRQWSKNYEMDVLWQLSIIGTSNYRNDSINRNETWNYLNVTKIYRNDKLNTLKWWYIIIIILYIHVFQINTS